MVIWAVLATIAAVVLTILFIAYRRQVRKTCRQLEFMKDYQTNLRLTQDLSFAELNELIRTINDVMDRSKEDQRAAQISEEALKETITNISHDIRTPLTSMDGYFQLLLQSGSTEESEHYIEVIRSRITSLKYMLEELFTYTKLQNQNYVLATEKIDFYKCAYELLFSFYDDFKQKGIEPDIAFSEGHACMQGNAEAVRRILQNIIRNALEHGHSKLSLKMYEKDANIIFSCSNKTEHPEEIDVSRVFSRFYKANAARTQTSTGLGLSIAKSLAEKMGGTAEAFLDGNWFTVQIQFPLCS